MSKIPSSMTNVATAASVSVSTDERWLVAQARGGDRGAARQLYDLHVRRIHRLVYRICEDEELVAYRHDGFWQPMDTQRDKLLLEDLWSRGAAPWRRW